MRQLREFVGQKMREGVAEDSLREVLMREGGWSPDDLSMIFAQVKATAMQSPLLPTTPVPPVAPIPSAQVAPTPNDPGAPTITTATTSLSTFSLDAPQLVDAAPVVAPAAVPDRTTPQVQTPATSAPNAKTLDIGPGASASRAVQDPSPSHLSLLLARLPYLRRILYTVAIGLVLLAGLVGYRISQWLQPVEREGTMREVTPVGGEVPPAPAPAVGEDTDPPNFPAASPVQDPADARGIVNPVPEDDSDPNPASPTSEGVRPSVRMVAIDGADVARSLAPGDKVRVSWEQSGGSGTYTSFTLKHTDSDVEYGNAGGGYFATGRLETSAYVPFGVPNGTYHVRVYARPTTCFPPEFKHIIQGYQPLLASTETNWCAEESYTLSDSSNTLSIISEE